MLPLTLSSLGYGAALVAIAYLIARLAWAILVPPPVPKYQPKIVGQMNAEVLFKHNGLDPTRSVLLAIDGAIYDVSECPLFSAIGPLSMMAGTEASRALSKTDADLPAILRRKGDPSSKEGLQMGAAPEDYGERIAADAPEEERATLRRWIDALAAKGFQVVGSVAAPRTGITAEELRANDGTEGRPVWLCIRGTVYDMSAGRRFYGPGGAYAVFAGRRVARALATFSVEEDACTDDVEGLTTIQMDGLADWEGKFRAKYDLVGTIAEDVPLRV